MFKIRQIISPILLIPILFLVSCGGAKQGEKIPDQDVGEVFDVIKSSIPYLVRDDLFLTDILYVKRTPLSSHGFSYTLTNNSRKDIRKSELVPYYQETAFLHACQNKQKAAFWKFHKINNSYLFRDNNGIVYSFVVLHNSCSEFRKMNNIKT